MQKSKILALSVLLLGTVALVGCTKKTVEAPTATNDTVNTEVPTTPTPVQASVLVNAQMEIKNGSVTIDKIVSKGPGWITIHADADDQPGAVIGYAPVNDGENLNIGVSVDAKKVTPKLYAMLHIDAGVIGTYEFPGTDVPALDDQGKAVSPSFMVTNSVSTTPIDPNAKVAAKTFNVNGGNYSFDVKQIKVKKGETVTINFTNQEGMHDWVIDEFNARTPRIAAGQTASVTFVADKAGTFEYYCSVGQHRANGMKGNLIVQ